MKKESNLSGVHSVRKIVSPQQNTWNPHKKMKDFVKYNFSFICSKEKSTRHLCETCKQNVLCGDGSLVTYRYIDEKDRKTYH